METSLLPLNHAIMSNEEVKTLIALAQSNDTTAREKIILGFLRLCVHISKRYSWTLPIEDLVQEGTIGLIEAIKRYDPEKGAFSTYASIWIEATMRRAVQKTPSVRASIRAQERAMKAYKNNASFNDVQQARGLVAIYSMSRQVTPTLTVGDIIARRVAVEPSPDDARVGLLIEALERAALSDQERRVLELRWFADERLTLQKVANVLGGISRQAVDCYEKKAFKKLREKMAMLEGSSTCNQQEQSS